MSDQDDIYEYEEQRLEAIRERQATLDETRDAREEMQDLKDLITG